MKPRRARVFRAEAPWGHYWAYEIREGGRIRANGVRLTWRDALARALEWLA